MITSRVPSCASCFMVLDGVLSGKKWSKIHAALFQQRQTSHLSVVFPRHNTIARAFPGDHTQILELTRPAFTDAFQSAQFASHHHKGFAQSIEAIFMNAIGSAAVQDLKWTLLDAAGRRTYGTIPCSFCDLSPLRNHTDCVGKCALLIPQNGHVQRRNAFECQA